MHQAWLAADRDDTDEAERLFRELVELRRPHGDGSRDLVGAESGLAAVYLERGDYNPSLDLAFRLSEVFEVPIEAIFSRKPLRPMSEELYDRHEKEGAK